MPFLFQLLLLLTCDFCVPSSLDFLVSVPKRNGVTYCFVHLLLCKKNHPKILCSKNNSFIIFHSFMSLCWLCHVVSQVEVGTRVMWMFDWLKIQDDVFTSIWHLSDYLYGLSLQLSCLTIFMEAQSPKRQKLIKSSENNHSRTLI